MFPQQIGVSHVSCVAPRDPPKSKWYFQATFLNAAAWTQEFCSHSPTPCTVVVKAMSFAAKIKPHKVLPAIRVLSALYLSSLLSLSGFLIAFTFFYLFFFFPSLEVSWSSSFWVPKDVGPAAPASSMALCVCGAFLALTSTAQDSVLARAVRELNKAFKIWSWVSAWAGNPASRAGKTWKCHEKASSPSLETHLHPVKVE